DITFSVDQTGKVTTTAKVTEDGVILIEDGLAGVKVSKVDIADGEELEGAIVQLLDKDGMIVKTWTSGTEPEELTGLKAGEEY
ncbi:SpaA isopeptide-forming pilin-related protein, partial [Klebsiella pneumoniae]|uniref:SpaA isopeptide-forming pilin-related protein n=1 Tax=Klebsiella pneumoniae TaxID=573 RepID=UPI0025A21E47